MSLGCLMLKIVILIKWYMGCWFDVYVFILISWIKGWLEFCLECVLEYCWEICMVVVSLEGVIWLRRG